MFLEKVKHYLKTLRQFKNREKNRFYGQEDSMSQRYQSSLNYQSNRINVIQTKYRHVLITLDKQHLKHVRKKSRPEIDKILLKVIQVERCAHIMSIL